MGETPKTLEEVRDALEEANTALEEQKGRVKYFTALQAFMERCDSWERTPDDSILLVYGSLEFNLYTWRWRPVDSPRWYYSKSPEDFMARHRPNKVRETVKDQIDLDLNRLEALLREAKENKRHNDRLNSDKLEYGRSAEKEVSRIEALIEFAENGADLREYGRGMVLVDNRYVYALATGRWRVKGKKKWYWSKGPASFLDIVYSKDYN